MADEFGDDTFLNDFDVDTAISQRGTLLSPTVHPYSNPYKKAKCLPLQALPFNAKITQGTKIDPHRELVTPERINSFVHQDEDRATVHTPDNTPVPTPVISVKPLLTEALTQTLQKYFGYSNFRSGQLEVIQACLEQRDVGVFWATGSGKSLCYQIPALHTGHIAVIVSPLISLMEDQVHKLNGLSEKPLATFLGSGQADATMEDSALDGNFPLVYVTPEKLLSHNFLDRLTHLHTTKNRLSLIAIDESHCVSEWGHDFRPEYRRLHAIRSHGGLKDVPIMALTATAIPRVQLDICTNLALRQPHIDRQSFDRDNLKIMIQRKRAGGISTNLRPLLSKLADKASTILYAPTRDQVEEVCSYLQQHLPDVQVEAYHAGMPQDQRTRAHTNFLVGKTHVICATVAFGMGIDKPDTRRVLHYGSPKTMEEYYQQIGRAGRDGLTAECLMLVNDADFDRYRSDFYTGRLSEEAKVIFEQSLTALRNFAMDSQTCRRKSLLSFFDEIPKFGDHCGTCDVCHTHAKHADDLERDLGPMGARLVLLAVSSLKEQGTSVLEKVISGNTVDEYRYIDGVNPAQIKTNIMDSRSNMEKKMPIAYFRELLAPLVSKGYLFQKVKKVHVPGQSFSRSFSYYEVTAKGREILHNPLAPILLPVPQSVRDIESELEEKRQKTLSALVTSGVDLSHIPQSEVEQGEGDAIRAFTKWHSYLDGLMKAGKHDRIQQLEDLRLRIDAWRLDTASMYRLSPSSVMAEHVVVRIAYSVASLRPGEKVEKEALVSAGVRSREIDSLVVSLHDWVEEVQPLSEHASSNTCSAVIVFDDEPFTPPKAWEFSSYKPKKTTGLATWESSHKRFLAGEHPQAIAMNPENGRPIQVATVISHILQGLELGRPVPLKKLAAVLPPPTEDDWNELSRAEEMSSMSVVGDPETSGVDGGKFSMTEFLRPIMGDRFVETPYNFRSSTDITKFAKWCEALRWYSALKRVGFEPTFKRVSAFESGRLDV